MHAVRLAIGISLLTAIPIDAQAVVREVPNFSTSIQVALTAAPALGPGDIVRITDNDVYDEQITLAGPTIEAAPGAKPKIRFTDDFVVSLGYGTIKGVVLERVQTTPLDLNYSANAIISSIPGCAEMHCYPTTINVEDCEFRVTGAGMGTVEGISYSCVDFITVKRCLFTGTDKAVAFSGFLAPEHACEVENSVLTFEDCVVSGRGVTFPIGSSQIPVGSAIVTGNTFDGTTGCTNCFDDNIAVDVGSGVTAARNIIANYSYAVVGGACENVTQNVFYNNSNNGCTNPDNLFNVDPLFCNSQESSVQKYTLRIDSPAAAANNTWLQRIGANDVECAFGTLVRNTTVAPSTQVTMLSDVTVPEAKTLTVGAGVVFKADDFDNAPGQGNDSVKNELIVWGGSLTVNGTSTSRVQFVGKTGTSESEWAGIVVNAGGTSFIDFAEVKNATYGVVIGGTGSNVIQNSTFSSNSARDIYVGAGSVNCVVGPSNTIAIGGGVGIQAASASIVKNNTLTGTGESAGGILISSNEAGYLQVRLNSITGCINGYGIQLAGDGGGPNVTENTTNTCYQGILITKGSPNIGTSSSTSDNVIQQNTYGIYAKCVGGGTCPGQCTINATVRNNRINFNQINVQSEKTANINLGTAGSYGRNSMGFYGAYGGCDIVNTSACGTISAVGNYFGDCEFFTPCVIGDVNTADALCLPPLFNEVPVEEVSPNIPLVLKGAFPNPFTTTTTLRFETAQTTRGVEVSIVDVSGRMVKTFDTLAYASGQHELVWDGRASDGHMVPAGLYFVVITQGNLPRASGKVFLTR